MPGNGTEYYLLTYHLGSASLTVNASGAKVAELRYKAWGENRYTSGNTSTSYRYTGQREDGYTELVQMGARWYDPLTSRWTQPDSIVPVATQGVQAWDRFAYANNSPVVYNDPTGHMAVSDGPVNDKFNKSAYNNYLRLKKSWAAMGDRYKGLANSMIASIGKNGSTLLLKAPSVTIGSPFFDPAADQYGSVSASIPVGNPSLMVEDPFGEAGPTGHPLDLFIRFINLVDLLLVNKANANISASGQPNVSLTTYYNTYDHLGLDVSGIFISNNSNDTLLLSTVQIEMDNYSETFVLSSSYEISSVEPGGFQAHFINSPIANSYSAIATIYFFTKSDLKIHSIDTSIGYGINK